MLRIFLLLANVAAMLGLVFALREEWSRITDYVAATVFFGGGMLLLALNAAYIQATKAEPAGWPTKIRNAWGALRA